MKKQTLLFLLIFKVTLPPSLCSAQDFDVVGNSFLIEEEDILKVIARELHMLDLNKINKDMKDKMMSYIDRPHEVRNMISAVESKEYLFDPSYTLEHDILDHKGVVIHFKGKKVNPLEFMPLREGLLFIDGNEEKQVQYALNIYKQKNGSLKIILVKGSPLKIQREKKVWVYFDQHGSLTSKMGITHIPALVAQEGLRLKVKILGREEVYEQDSY